MDNSVDNLNYQSNARIVLDGERSKPYELYENMNVVNDKFENITGNLQKSELAHLYFTQENVDYIQTQVIRRVYEKTNNTHQIGKQSEDELIIVMRSIYLQHSKNMKDRIDEQINILNEMVLDYCVDNVLTNLQQYLKYVYDISTNQHVIDTPIHTNNKGRNSLELKPPY